MSKLGEAVRQQIVAVADNPGKVEIHTSTACFSVVTTVDTVKEEIVSVRISPIYCF